MRKLFLTVLALLVVGGAAQAQSSAVGMLIMLINGDYYAWNESDPAPQRLTTWGYNFRPALSPDGKFLAYMSWSPMTVEAIRRSGGIGGGELPGDIKLFDLATAQETIIAGQPADASFFIEGTADKAIMRSTPAWSPDGRRLAWTEFDYPGELLNRLVVYDVTTRESRVIVPLLPAQGGVPSPMPVLWSGSGIIVRSITPRPNVTTYQEDVAFLVYDDTGALLATVPLPQTDADLMIDYLLVQHNGQDYIAVLYNNAAWVLLNPLTGDSTPAPGQVQLRGADTGISALAAPVVAGTPTDGQWDMISAQGEPVGLSLPLNFAPSASPPAFSPDGQAVAYIIGDTSHGVEVWRSGQTVTVPPPEEDQLISGVIWAPPRWGVYTGGGFSAEPPSAFNCPDALPPLLVVGGQGRVIGGGGPNNLRAEPFTSAAIIGEIPAGGTFTILRGPDCGGDVIWWQVEVNGITGWTAESQGQNYFTEPVQ